MRKCKKSLNYILIFLSMLDVLLVAASTNYELAFASITLMDVFCVVTELLCIVIVIKAVLNIVINGKGKRVKEKIKKICGIILIILALNFFVVFFGDAKNPHFTTIITESGHYEHELIMVEKSTSYGILGILYIKENPIFMKRTGLRYSVVRDNSYYVNNGCYRALYDGETKILDLIIEIGEEKLQQLTYQVILP